MTQLKKFLSAYAHDLKSASAPARSKFRAKLAQIGASPAEIREWAKLVTKRR